MPPLYSMKRCRAVASLCMLISGCYWGIPPADDGWSAEAPELHGMDSALLKEVAEAVREIGGRQGFLVARNGVIVHETYYWGKILPPCPELFACQRTPDVLYQLHARPLVSHNPW